MVTSKNDGIFLRGRDWFHPLGHETQNNKPTIQIQESIITLIFPSVFVQRTFAAFWYVFRIFQHRATFFMEIMIEKIQDHHSPRASRVFQHFKIYSKI